MNGWLPKSLFLTALVLAAIAAAATVFLYVHQFL